MRRPLNWLADHPWALILGVAVVGLALWAKSTRSSDYDVMVMFDDAVSVSAGLDVRVDGLDAGKVKNVEQRDGGAVVTLGLRDDRVYPLHEGTTAAMRFGTTIGNGTRRIDLHPGPKSAPEIPDGGIIRNSASVEATEFDEIFDTFDARTRNALQGAMAGTARTFGPRGRELGAGVDASAGGLDAVGDFANDLAADTPALRAVVANTYRVTRAIAARRTQLSDLVGVSAATFRTFAQNTRGITASLDRFPATAQEIRTTLARMDGTVDGLQPLIDDLRPGARQLSGLARDLRPALADLRATVPSAVSAFRTARRTAPAITGLLRQSVPFSAGAAPALTQLAPMVACVRPYAPEAAGLLTTWVSWNQLKDSKGNVGRLWANYGATSNSSSVGLNAGTVTSAGLQNYALIRPPGLNAGKPTFNDKCGLTQKGVTASQDPEDGK